MKLLLLLISLLGSSLLNVLLAERSSYITTPDGVIVFTDPLFTGTANAVKLEVREREAASSACRLAAFFKKERTGLAYNIVCQQ